MAEPKRKGRQSPNWHRSINRLNLILAVVSICFFVLLIRLVDIQLVKGKTFDEMVQAGQENVTEQAVPRGEIIDRNGKPLVTNLGFQEIRYTRGNNVTAKEMATIAGNLAKLIAIDTDMVTENDQKDYYLALNPEKINERLNRDERYLSASDLHRVQLEKITSKDLKTLGSKAKEASEIYKKMKAAGTLKSVAIKNKGVTNEEVAIVSEHSSELEGISAGVDWIRQYPQDELLRSLLGNVTTETQGLPSEQAASYLAKGYSSDDRVGTSYIEKQYESVLHGSKSQQETTMTNEGEVKAQVQTYAGHAGETVQLTIDTDFQKKVQDILKSYLINQSTGNNRSIYAVVSDPNNGQVLAIAGEKRQPDGSFLDDALGNISSSFVMGSAVKAATVAAGYHYDVLSTDSNNIFVDQPLYFTGTPMKHSIWSSYTTAPQPMSDIQALTKSSNVYMVRVAMAIGGLKEYKPGMTVDLAPGTATKLRNVYAQFGLGVSTGIDLENEATGIQGAIQAPGNVLDMAYGQYDTYTNMEMNQYIATLANGGNRYALTLLKGIYRSNGQGQTTNQLIAEPKPRLLNKVQLDQDEIDRIKRGLYGVTHTPGGTAYSDFAGFPVAVAGKTGTAETGTSLVNSSFVAFAPYDHPQVAVSIIVPDVVFGSEAAAAVGAQVLRAYFG